MPVGAHIVRPGGKSAVFWCMSNMWGGLAGAHCAPLRGADEMRDRVECAPTGCGCVIFRLIWNKYIVVRFFASVKSYFCGEYRRINEKQGIRYL